LLENLAECFVRFYKKDLVFKAGFVPQDRGGSFTV
jgi:hypothetical protein